MAISDYWIYQAREVVQPWTVYLCRIYERGKPATESVFDWTIYHDSIPNRSRSRSGINLACKYGAFQPASFIATELAKYTPITGEDVDQLHTEFKRILGLEW